MLYAHAGEHHEVAPTETPQHTEGHTAGASTSQTTLTSSNNNAFYISGGVVILLAVAVAIVWSQLRKKSTETE